MKKHTHPESRPTCFKDVSTGKKFLGQSTLKPRQKEVIDGIEYGVVLCDVTADSHPAYTGERRFVDTAGRVEKFQARHQRQRRG